MPNAVCGCEDTGLLFIHLIYLYFFPEGELLVSLHLCWLLAITEHLEPLLNWPEGSSVLKRSTRFRDKRCVCCVYFCGDVTECVITELTLKVITNTNYLKRQKKEKLVSKTTQLLQWLITRLFLSCSINYFSCTVHAHCAYKYIPPPPLMERCQLKISLVLFRLLSKLSALFFTLSHAVLAQRNMSWIPFKDIFRIP